VLEIIERLTVCWEIIKLLDVACHKIDIYPLFHRLKVGYCKMRGHQLCRRSPFCRIEGYLRKSGDDNRASFVHKDFSPDGHMATLLTVGLG